MAVTREKVAAPRASGKQRFFWFVLLAGTMVFVGYIFAGVMIYRYGSFGKYGYEAVFRGDGWYISGVYPQGPADGKLQVGDKILAINGDTRVRHIGYGLKLFSVPLGQYYTAQVERQGVNQEVELKLSLFPTRVGFRLRIIFIALAFSIEWYIIALLIGFLKPGEKIPRLAFGAFLFVAINLLSFSVLGPMAYMFEGLERNIYFLISVFSGGPLVISILYHLYYCFPPGVPEGPFWTFLKRLLYACGTILFLADLSLREIVYSGQKAMTFYFDNNNLLQLYSYFGDTFVMLGFSAIYAVIARNSHLVKEPDQRYRVKWVIYGSITGALPAVALSLGFFIARSAEYRYIPMTTAYNVSLTYNNFIWSVLIASVTVPIAWGYAIIKHRVFDINVFIRRGVQYLLAQNMLRLILALPIMSVVYAILSNPDRTLKEMLLTHPIYPLLIAATALSLKFRRQLSTGVDRRFFREAYNQEQILLRLIDEIKESNSTAEIARLVSQQVDSALHLTRIYIFYRKASNCTLTLGYSSGESSHDLSIPDNWQLLRLMETQASTQEYPFPPHSNLPLDEQAWLNQRGVHLLVPITGTDGRLIGLLLLGEKKSEQPYTPNDCRLLQIIARQMALAYETAQLKEQVTQERKIKHEVLAHLEEQRINLIKECPACGTCYDSVLKFCTEDGAVLTLTLPVERTIEGKYRLEKLIGKGGMGAVYRATDLRLGRPVALKILTGDMFGNQAALQRFEREARASARLNHPNIVTVYDYGPAGAKGAYLVMELLSGFTLRSELKRVSALVPAVASAWFEQICEGVTAAHQAGVIHRDLKPENILITISRQQHTQIKILDFGLAKLKPLEGLDSHSLTAPGTIMGTLGYMPPEQLQGHEIDERADIFAIGVMVVEALTGRLPFDGRTIAELLNSIWQNPYHLLSQAQEAQRLNAVLQRCLANDQAHRYSSVTELQRELIPAIRQCPSFGTSGRRQE